MSHAKQPPVTPIHTFNVDGQIFTMTPTAMRNSLVLEILCARSTQRARLRVHVVNINPMLRRWPFVQDNSRSASIILRLILICRRHLVVLRRNNWKVQLYCFTMYTTSVGKFMATWSPVSWGALDWGIAEKIHCIPRPIVSVYKLHSKPLNE